jgi:hypothetical protein
MESCANSVPSKIIQGLCTKLAKGWPGLRGGPPAGTVKRLYEEMSEPRTPWHGYWPPAQGTESVTDIRRLWRQSRLLPTLPLHAYMAFFCCRPSAILPGIIPVIATPRQTGGETLRGAVIDAWVSSWLFPCALSGRPF